MARPIVKYLDPISGEYEFATVVDVGDLRNLNTTIKSDIVGAINSIISDGVHNPINDEKIKDLERIISSLKDGTFKIDDFGSIDEYLKQQFLDELDRINEKNREEIQSVLTQLDTSVDDAIKDYQEKVAAQNIILENAENTLADARDTLEAKAAELETANIGLSELKTDFNELDGYISTNIRTIDFDNFNAMVEDYETVVTQTSDEVGVDMSGSTLSYLTGRVTDAEANISAQADEITSKMSYDEFQYMPVPKYSYGENLLFNTFDFGDAWNGKNGAQVTTDTFLFGKVVAFNSPTGLYETLTDDLTIGESYVFSTYVNVQPSEKSPSQDKYGPISKSYDPTDFKIQIGGKSFNPGVYEDLSGINGWVRINQEFVADAVNPIISITPTGVNSQSEVAYMAMPKLEKGLTVTPWQPHVEDNYATLSSTQSMIKQQANSITAFVTEVSELDDSYKQATSTFKMLADGFAANTEAVEAYEDAVTRYGTEYSNINGKFEQKVWKDDFKTVIEDINIDNRNRVLNSDFIRSEISSSDRRLIVEDWSLNSDWELKTIDNDEYLSRNRTGLVQNLITSASSNYFPVRDGERILFGFDLIHSGLDNDKVFAIELFDINDRRLLKQEFSLSSLTKVGNRYHGSFSISTPGAEKGSVVLQLPRNGSVSFTKVSFQNADIGSVDWSPAPEDSWIIQSKLATYISQVEDEITIGGTGQKIDTLTGLLTEDRGTFTLNPDKIATEVLNSQTYDDMGFVNKTNFEQTADGWMQEITSEGRLAGYINASPDTYRISFDKIMLEGTTWADALGSSKITVTDKFALIGQNGRPVLDVNNDGSINMNITSLKIGEYNALTTDDKSDIEKEVTDNVIRNTEPYVHIAYADTEDGQGISFNPSGKQYIGFAKSHLPTPSGTASNYEWSKYVGADGYEGADGVGIKSTAIRYASSTSGTSQPSTGWSSTIPTVEPGNYLWTEIVWTYTNSEKKHSYTVARIGADGADGKDGVVGKDGVGIQKTEIHYASSASGTTKPSTGWSLAVPSVSPGNYLWTRTTWTYTDTDVEEGYSVSRIGKDGNTGKDGVAGKDGVGIKSTVINYATSSSGTTKPTSGWTSTVPSVTPGNYLWTRTVWTYTDNDTEEGYSVSRIGKDGAKGDTGDTGAAGTGIKSTEISYVIHTNGTTAPTLGWVSTVPSPVKGRYMWTRTITTYTDNTTSTTYSVAYQATDGQRGETGATGTGVSSTAVTYAQTTSGTTTPTSWSATRPAPIKGQYLWSRTIITYTNGSSSTAYSTSYSATDGQKGDKGDIGPQGPQGIKGDNGLNGQSQWVHVRYSVNANGSGMTTSPSSTTKYVGIAVTNSATAPAYTGFTWSKYVGENGVQGPQGVPGKNGANGTTTYTWVKYADTPTSGMNQYPDGKKYIGLAFNQTTQTESDNYNDYQWSLMPQNIEIGGRNLLRNSDEKVSNGSYNIARYDLTDEIKENEEVTLTIWGSLAATKSYFSVYNSGGSVNITTLTNNGDGTYSRTFKWKIGSSSNTFLNVYAFTNAQTGISTINKIKLEKGNTATDWTPAPEDVTASIKAAQDQANAASQEAIAAQADATVGKNMADNLSNDSIITQVEKLELKREWDAIVKEKPSITTQATDYALQGSTEATNYNTAYTALNNSIPSLLTNMKVTSTVARATFNNNFANYYDRRQLLLNRIAKKAKELADVAQSSVDNLEVGGRNLIVQQTITRGRYLTATNTFTGDAQWFYTDYIPVSGYTKMVTSGYTNLGNAPSVVYYDSSKNFVRGVNNNGQSRAKDITINSGEAFIRFSGMIRDLPTIKLEKGNKATDWTPAPEDVEAAYTAVAQAKAEAERTNAQAYADGIVSDEEEARIKDANAKLTAAKQHAENISKVQDIGGGNKKFINVGGLVTQTSSRTGYLVIKTPLTSAYMTKMKISGYNYVTRKTNIDITVSFYAYSNNTFHQYGFISNGDYSYDKVQLARDSSGKTVVIIGNQSDAYSYPIVSIDEVLVTYGTPPDSFKNGFSAEIVTDISMYTNVVNIPGEDTKLKISAAQTAANNAATAASNAQGTATAASNSASTANNLLSDIASDSKLTATEKKAAKKEWDIIVGEKPKIDISANTYGITTEKTAYNTAYNTLNNYLSSLLANLNTTSNIVGTTFRSNFRAYYNARQDLLNKIADSAKSLVDGIEIGGVNMIVNSNKFDYSTTGTNLNTNILTNVTEPLIVGKEYTFSFDIKATANGKSNRIFINSSMSIYKDFNFTSEWTRHFVTFVYNGGTYSGRQIHPHLYPDMTGTKYIRNVKLETGNKATDWTPAPEDVALDVNKKTYNPVRYIRDWSNGSTANNGNHWYELMAIDEYGNNKALGRTVTSNGSGSNFPHLTNGVTSIGTYASATNSEGAVYLQVDLGQIYYNIVEIKVWKYYNDGRTYNENKTEVSSDGVTWYPIYDYTVEGEYTPTSEGKSIPNTIAKTHSILTGSGTKNLIDLKAESERIKTEAYADGKVSAEEKKRIADAEDRYRKALILSRASSGKLMNSDPNFSKNLNEFTVYNNAANGNVVVLREEASSSTGPSGVTRRLRVTTTGTASPHWGGIVPTPALISRANAEYVIRFTALLPKGRSFHYAQNAMGTGYTGEWLTSAAGTGTWEEYIYYYKCGSAGSFSSFGHLYALGGTAPTTASPLIWYIDKYEALDISNVTGNPSQEDVDEKASAEDLINAENGLSTSIGDLSNIVDGKVDKSMYEEFLEHNANIQEQLSTSTANAQADITKALARTATVEQKLGEGAADWIFTHTQIRMSDEGITLGEQGSGSYLQITNDQISFYNGSADPVAFINGGMLHINHAIFVESIQISEFMFSSEAPGHLTLRYVGK